MSICIFSADVASMFGYNNGCFQFKIQFLKMIRHASYIAGPSNTVMVGKIKNGILIKLNDHGKISVSPGGSHMLTKGITIAAGNGKRYGSQQGHIAWVDTPIT